MDNIICVVSSGRFDKNNMLFVGSSSLLLIGAALVTGSECPFVSEK